MAVNLVRSNYAYKCPVERIAARSEERRVGKEC